MSTQRTLLGSLQRFVQTKSIRLAMILCAVSVLINCGADGSQQAFEAYVKQPHPLYTYKLHSTVKKSSYTTYYIRMVSQHWLSQDQVNDPEWWHWLTIVVPNEVKHDTALLMIGAGDKLDSLPKEPFSVVTDAALATQSVVIHLHNVPAQPLIFSENPFKELYEDEIIAYGWRKFLEGGAKNADAPWVPRLPMTAAAMRAMDTVSDFTKTTLGITLNHYVVAGESKRGWATWTTGIFDPRVVAIIPIVVDTLNVARSIEHHWRVYGEWSHAISDYVENQIMEWQGSKEYARLLQLEDPYSYLNRLTIPKYIVNATGDQFFPPDSWQFYWNDLPGEKHLRYIPNTGHSLRETDADESLIAFYSHILDKTDLPRFDWTIRDNQFTIQYDPNNPPARLRLWYANNPQARDFRIDVIGASWTSMDLNIEKDGSVVIPYSAPQRGFTAGFVEAEFGTPSGYPFKQTTGVAVTPNIYPLPPFKPSAPLGTR